MNIPELDHDLEAAIDDAAEKAFWEFDKRRKQTGEERLAFKAEWRNAFAAGEPFAEAIAAWNRRSPTGGQDAEWRPIESAPKDGSVLILHTDQGAVAPGYFKDHGFVGGAWHWCEDHDWNPAEIRPTRWMPLHEPPKESGK